MDRMKARRRERRKGDRVPKRQGAAGSEGAEFMLTSIQEEDILSFYAAHVIFIA